MPAMHFQYDGDFEARPLCVNRFTKQDPHMTRVWQMVTCKQCLRKRKFEPGSVDSPIYGVLRQINLKRNHGPWKSWMRGDGSGCVTFDTGVLSQSIEDSILFATPTDMPLSSWSGGSNTKFAAMMGTLGDVMFNVLEAAKLVSLANHLELMEGAVLRNLDETLRKFEDQARRHYGE